MTDDNLDDVQPKKIILECSEKELRLIWNAAIEAAAKVAEINSAANIRKLKK
jgi:hypothetical protein